MNILIIDYHTGNLASLVNSLGKASLNTNKKINVKVGNSPQEILLADKIILPGVGDFSNCKKKLEGIEGMIESLNDYVNNLQRPFLGICIGMQLMAKSSEERGKHRGLGYFNANVCKIKPDKKKNVKIPHMGWNTTIIKNRDIKGKFKSLNSNDFYFVHSFKMVCNNKNDVLASVNYGQEIVATILKNNIIGVQFHPEKSQIKGLNFLSEFISWEP